MSMLPNTRTSVIGFILLYLAYCISYIDRSAISIALAQIGKDYHLEASDLGIVISAFFLGYTIMQIPGGWLADRYGSKWVVIAATIMWSIFTVTTSFAWSLTSLIAIRFLFGLAEGGFPAASFKALAELFAKPNRPKLSSLLVSSNYAGSMVAPMIMAPLILGFGWRHAFEIIGIAGIAFAAIYFFAVPHLRGDTDPIEPAKGANDAGTETRQLTGNLLKNPFMWQMLVIWFGLSCVNKGLDSWMPLYLLQERGLDLKSVGMLTPIPFVLATIATAIGGWVMTTVFPDREKYMLIGAALLTGIFLYFMATASSIPALIFFQSLVYFFKSFVFAGVVALPTKMLRQAQIGVGLGMINFGGQSAGFIAPMVIGFIVSGTGSFNAAFAFLVVMCAISATVAATIRSAPMPRIIAGPV
jgi:MFS family permease